MLYVGNILDKVARLFLKFWLYIVLEYELFILFVMLEELEIDVEGFGCCMLIFFLDYKIFVKYFVF